MIMEYLLLVFTLALGGFFLYFAWSMNKHIKGLAEDSE